MRFRGRSASGVLQRQLCGLLGLAGLFLGALRLAARLAELLFRIPELVLELLQLALEIADLPLDRSDPVSGRVLRVGRGALGCGHQVEDADDDDDRGRLEEADEDVDERRQHVRQRLRQDDA